LHIIRALEGIQQKLLEAEAKVRETNSEKMNTEKKVESVNKEILRNKQKLEKIV
jgi:peptidoglycan hydrolase CwlO-like protein